MPGADHGFFGCQVSLSGIKHKSDLANEKQVTPPR